ncbi:MAG: hypothetical protein IJJ33_17360 [Victivallales bacterium]|nr:hypothetical protein [Victivallales bacterium]
MKRVFLTIVVLLYGAGSTLTATIPEPLLSIEFDGDCIAQTRQGAIQGKPTEGKPLFVPGKFGQALKSGQGLPCVDFTHPKLLNRQAGSIEMWVKREGWEPDDPAHHVWFENLDGPSWLVFYKFSAGSKVFSLTGATRKQPYIIAPYTTGYNHCDTFFTGKKQPGAYRSPLQWYDDWAHFVMVWSPDGNMTYMNAYPGKNAWCKSATFTQDYDFGTAFRVGDQSWTTKSSGASLIDRVRVYDHALSADEILALYHEGLYGADVPLKPELLSIDYDGDPVAHTIHVHVCSGGAPLPAAQVAGNLVKTGAMPEKWLPFQVKDDTGDLTLPLGDFAGKCDIVVKLDETGRVLARKSIGLPDLSWQGNTLGMKRKVMEPWTPVSVQGQKVQVWNREYEFANAPLPTQVTSGGEMLLASPVHFEATTHNHPVAWQNPTMKVTSCDGYSAVVEGSVTATGNGQSATLTVRTEIEFDGFSLINVRTDRPEFFATLSLDIPLKEERALYHHFYSRQRRGESGFLAKGTGEIFSREYIPYFWLGDNDRGLFWACETTQFWPNGEGKDAIQEVRSRDSNHVSLRLNLLAQGQRLPENWDYQFMLQATPIKPMPPNWRRLRFRQWFPKRMEEGIKMNLGYYNLGAVMTTSMAGYPDTDNLELVRKHVKWTRENGIALMPYLGLTCEPTFMPEWPFFKDEWYMGTIDLDPASIDRATGIATMNAGKKSYRDFLIWKIAKFMKETGYTAQYHDNSFPYASSFPKSGLAYVKDGKTFGAFNILATRELNRRNRAVMQQNIPGYQSMAHMSSRIWCPILSFDDYMVFGENYRGNVNDNYTDIIPLDRFRAEYMGRQWGLVPIMLTELTGKNREAVKPTRGLFVLTQLHDVFIWAVRANLQVQEECTAPLEKFGYQDAEFIPYFDPQPPAAADQPRVLVSAYRRKDTGKVLLFIGNLGRKPAATTVTVDLARLGLSGKVNAIDQVNENPVPMQNNQIKLEVEDEGFRMIRLEKFAPPEINIWG